MTNTIPGFLLRQECEFLNKLFSPYNCEGTVGIEIGSFLGRSSYEISRAIPLGKLFCIDLWSNWEVGPPSKFYKPGHYYASEGSKCSLNEFLQNTKDCTNITPIQGSCPECVSDWSEPVTFVFLDAAHYNPSDRISIDFWLPKIRNGGIFAGHDYVPTIPDRYPHIKENIRYMENLLGQTVSHSVESHSIWYFNI